MNTYDYCSDIDDVDDATYQMLDSRFCKLALHSRRQPTLRHQREQEPRDTSGFGHRNKRVRERHVYE